MITKNNIKKKDQYSLTKILLIWAAAAFPMAILGWLIAPALTPDINKNPILAGTIRIVFLTVGLIWQFILSMIIIFMEEGDLRWKTVKNRLWLNGPIDPKTGRKNRKLWLWVIPLLILAAAVQIGLSPILNGVWVKTFPFFAEPANFAFGPFLESPDVQAKLVGAWWFLGLITLSAVFNTFLGEEFLFRGILLPKMKGVFGKWDWVANGVLFTLYHLHQPWGMLSVIIIAVFLFALPTKRFRSSWFAIITHSGQSIFFIFLMLGIVLGVV